MSVRNAKFGDVPAIWSLMQEMHLRSVYHGWTTLNEAVAKKLVVNAIQRQGATCAGGSTVIVWEAPDGTVEGFMIVVLQRIYHALDELSATDMYVYASQRAGNTAALSLYRAYIEWCVSNPNVHVIDAGATNGITDYRGTERLLSSMGFEQVGVIYQRRIAR